MTFQLTINTDNAAFEDDGQELARILRELASQAEISLALYAKVTNTLASLSGVPGATHPDGSPVYVERVRGQKHAQFARCSGCSYIIGDGLTYGLAENVRRHRTGQCRTATITYWRWL